MKQIDLQTWDRKEYFEHFSAFEEPYHGLVLNIDCTEAYNKCKQSGASFFAKYMYESLRAVNEIEAFKYRIENQQIVLCDTLHGGSTIGRADGTFAFAFIPYVSNEEAFNQSLSLIKQRVQAAKGMCKDADCSRIDMIHYSTVPWIQFTGLTHARNFKHCDGIPKITFGKLFDEGDRKLMPLAINVHHGFVDGLQIAQYMELFQTNLNA